MASLSIAVESEISCCSFPCRVVGTVFVCIVFFVVCVVFCFVLLMLCFAFVLLSPQEVLHNQGVCSVYLKQYDKVRTCEHAPITLCAIWAILMSNTTRSGLVSMLL